LRAKSSAQSTSTVTSSIGDSGYALSSPNSTDTMVASSISSRASSKRYSNNLFGSGRFRDYSYVRSVTQQQQQRDRSVRTRESATPQTIRNHGTDDSSAPEETDQSDLELDATSFEKNLSKSIPRDRLHRASMALGEAIREIEEENDLTGNEDEGDDKVLVPRSPVDARGIAVRHCPFF
jgi:serine/arginine repetitive matrix protein 2